MGAVTLEGVHKSYPGGAIALRGIGLEIEDGELVVLVGPSGCGKSTALRVVAGLESPTRGRVHIDGRDVTELDPRERDVAMVFQSYALYPHRSVRENLAFGLRMRGAAAETIARRIDEVAAQLDLAALLERRPSQLSGGQRQRVALGRALVREPRVFLLDEPLSNLDAVLRVATRGEIARLHRRLGATLLYVTHDQEEAMTLGQRIAVMRDGRIEQLGAPLEIYERPATRFVAEFIGSPAISWLRARVDSGAGRGGLRLAGRGWTQGLSAEALQVEARALPCEVWVGVRAHDWRAAQPSANAPGEGEVLARVELVEQLGSSALVHAETAAGEALRWQAPARSALEAGASIALGLPPDRLHVFDAESGGRVGT